MKNKEIAKIFYEIADYLEMDKVAFKPFAYRRAALALEGLEKDVEEIYKRGGEKEVEEIGGVGKSLSEKIIEYLKTGKILYYEQFKRRLPLNLSEITAVEGMGPQRAKFLYQKLGIANLKDLEKAAMAHKIAGLFGFGDKAEKNILQGIEFVKRSKGRFLLDDILPKAKEVLENLKKLKGVERADLAGSLKRGKETIGDVDFLVISKNPKVVMDFFVSQAGVLKIWQKGATKSSVRMREGFDMDVRVLPRRSFGAGLQYFTGSKEHNIALRIIAMSKGLKLSEYGLFRGAKIIESENEEKLYNALGMDWPPPQIREDRGEIEAAQKHILPKLISLSDMRGDLHCHSSWDGGVDSIETMAKAAKALGHEYIGIADHTKFLRIEHGLDEKELERRNKEIDKLNSKPSLGIKILKGCEANILKDGSLDIKDEALAQLDFVIAGVHSNFKMARDEMTARIIKAMENPHLDIISHPTGRILKRRDEYLIDFDEIVKAAKRTGTILEINSSPLRLDLNDINIKKCKEAGVKMIINTDAHNKLQLSLMEYGILQAQRGWAEKADIINTWSVEKLLALF
jgi:DNA polymerase (family X)